MFITKPKFYLICAGMMVLTLLFSIPALAGTVYFPDIQGHWAQKAVEELTAKGVLQGYPDGTFKPDQPITRAEMAKVIAKNFNYQPVNQEKFADISTSWARTYINSVSAHQLLNAYPDGGFHPAGTVNRVKLASMVSQLLNLVTPQEKFNNTWPTSFTDVPANYWGFRYIELANKLGVLPASFKTEYHPDQALTRAEAVWMVKSLNDLTVSKGVINQVDPDTGLVNVQIKSKNDPVLAMVTPETVLLRNNVTTDIDSLLAGDEATVIALPSGEVKFFKAFGKVTKNDLLSQVSSMTKGHLTPEMISSIVAGDWQTVKDDLQGGLYNRLMGLGLSSAEAESIMVKDWNYLDTLSRDRLAQALSGLLGISVDFSQALLAKDTQKIKEYGKIELATAALSKLLGVNGDQNGAIDSQYGSN